MKKFNVGTIKMNMETNGFPKGLILKRPLTTRESRHILYKYLGININTIDDCYDNEEYKEYNKQLTTDVNKWLTGDIDDDAIMDYAYDCADDPIGIMNIIPIIGYLKKKNIID